MSELAASDPRAGGGGTLAKKIGSLRLRAPALLPLGVLVLLGIVIGLIAPNFLSTGNMTRIAVAASIPLVLACGMTFVIIMGSIDLSTEGLTAVAAVVLSLVVGNAVNQTDIGLLAVPLTILLGAVLGFVNGVVHVRLRIPSLIASLGLGFIALGIATVILQGSTVRVTDPDIRNMALYRVYGIPMIVLVAAAALGIAWIFQEYTRLGRWSYVLGGGEDVARLSGVPTSRVRIGVFTLAGAFYGLGGALYVAQFGQAQALISQGVLFTVITAVVVGGTALTGGVGGVLCSLVGVLLVTVLGNGMVLMGIPPALQQGMQGLLIIVAVALSVDRQRSRAVK